MGKNDFKKLFDAKAERYREICRNMSKSERLKAAAQLYYWSIKLNPDIIKKELKKRSKNSFILR